MRRSLLLAALLLVAAAPAQLTERERAEHALNRLAFGARPGDVERVMQVGVERWVAQQLRPEGIDDPAIESRLRQYETLGLSDDEVMEQFAKPLFEARRKRTDGETMRLPREQRPQRLIAELSAQRILRAAESERQLNEVMVDFWMNHFNVFAGKGLDRFLLTSYERDVIRPHIWGSFDTLLLATAKSPAMLFYLDNLQSIATPENRPVREAMVGGGRLANGRGRRQTIGLGPAVQPDVASRQLIRNGGLNENYARELLELHTLGVDGGYTQKDVTELARLLTGWSLERPRQGKVNFVFRAQLHDTRAKTILGTRFPDGGGIEEGERMIRFLATHPSTARHLARKLCQRLVADQPLPALVERVAQRFLATNGDLRATVKAVIDSDEFWQRKHYRAKVKSPFEYAISVVRAAGARIVDPLPLARELEKIGQPLYRAQAPTGYSDLSEAWVSSGALVNRINFAIALATNKMPGVRVPVSDTLAKQVGAPEFQMQ